MISKRSKYGVAVAVGCLVLLCVGFAREAPAGTAISEPTIPNVTVRFGVSGTVDHTTVAIGLAQGWFKEVGIDIRDRVVVGAGRLPALVGGGLDVLDYYSLAVVPTLEENPNVRWFFSQDMFYGFALVGKPEYKTYQDFLKEGNSPEAAIRKAVSQMKGKTFLSANVPSTKGFEEILFERGGTSVKDMKLIELDQEKHIGTMFAGQADFEVGNVPTRVTLESKGFKPIVSTRDVIEYLQSKRELTPESKELTMMGFSGWMSTKKYYEENHETILRLTGVGFRIMQMINDKPKEALKYHLPYTNRVAGTNLTEAEGLIVYNSLDPFRSFEYQKRWYYDEKDYENWKWSLLATIRLWENKGVLTKGRFPPESFSRSQVIYNELMYLREKAQSLIWDASDTVRIARAKGKATGSVEETIKKARHHFDIFNYYDSYRFALAAKEQADKL